MATAVCEAIKKKYPDHKLMTISNFPEVFFNNPNVDVKLRFNELSYLHEQYVEGYDDNKYFLLNPQATTEIINQTEHVLKVWCDLFDIKYNGELPRLYLNQREKDFYSRQFASQKPIMVIQTNGGQVNQPNKYSWTRDLPYITAQNLVNYFARSFQIYHVRREDQLELQNTISVSKADLRTIAALISISTKRLFIDSFCQQLATAMGKPSVVCWVGTKPEQYGYKMHTNIIANQPTVKPDLKYSVFTKYNTAGNPTEFCYKSEEEVFSINAIAEAIVNQKDFCEIPDNIRAESQKGSMVARRLTCLLGKADLENVTQILDIGSRDILQSFEFAKIFDDARIDAFEPVPESYDQCLKNKSQLNELMRNRVNVHNVAISNEQGEIPFYAVDPEKSSAPNVGASSMFPFIDGLNGTPFGQNLVQNEIKVKAETLDNWCEENKVVNVDIMWIDVQGSELHVFQGANKILKNTRIIMTEVGLKPYYEGHTLKKDIDEFLFERGFKELEGSFEMNGFDYEANTIYIKS